MERPKITKKELIGAITRKYGDNYVDRKAFPVIVIGIRGYYKNSMGEVGKNDRGIYDDCICLDSKNLFEAYNGNTDPSFKYKDGLACLEPGIYYAHNIGLHKGQYTALVQRKGMVDLLRDGGKKDKGFFGINIHEGGVNSTSSEGCQTIPKGTQYQSFISKLEEEMKLLHGKGYREKTVPYILLEEEDLREKKVLV